jgi:hypothetical protein
VIAVQFSPIVKLEVVVEVTGQHERAEAQDVLAALEAAETAGERHPVLDEVAAGDLDETRVAFDKSKTFDKSKARAAEPKGDSPALAIAHRGSST